MLVSLATILQQQYLKTASLYICQFTFALTEKIASLISALAFGDTEMVNVKLCKFYLNNKKLETKNFGKRYSLNNYIFNN